MSDLAPSFFGCQKPVSNAGRTGMLKEDRHVTGDEARGRRAIKGSGMGNKPESNRRQVRSEGGHAWNLKGECRFCGMSKQSFRENGRPNCEGIKRFPKTRTR